MRDGGLVGVRFGGEMAFGSVFVCVCVHFQWEKKY